MNVAVVPISIYVQELSPGKCNGILRISVQTHVNIVWHKLPLQLGSLRSVM